MITAKEASELYNGNLLLRDKYIEEVLEPLIKENINVKLTEEIIKTLEENGYKVNTICALGTQEFDGKGELTISWD